VSLTVFPLICAFSPFYFFFHVVFFVLPFSLDFRLLFCQVSLDFTFFPKHKTCPFELFFFTPLSFCESLVLFLTLTVSLSDIAALNFLVLTGSPPLRHLLDTHHVEPLPFFFLVSVSSSHDFPIMYRVTPKRGSSTSSSLFYLLLCQFLSGFRACRVRCPRARPSLVSALCFIWSTCPPVVTTGVLPLWGLNTPPPMRPLLCYKFPPIFIPRLFELPVCHPPPTPDSFPPMAATRSPLPW